MNAPQPCGMVATTTHCCEYHAIHSDDDFAAQRIKLEGARQIFERLRYCTVPVELSRRIDHWLASASPSEEERLMDHLLGSLVKAALGWSAEDGTTLDELQLAAHELRLAGEGG